MPELGCSHFRTALWDHLLPYEEKTWSCPPSCISGYKQAQPSPSDHRSDMVPSRDTTVAPKVWRCDVYWWGPTLLVLLSGLQGSTPARDTPGTQLPVRASLQSGVSQCPRFPRWSPHFISSGGQRCLSRKRKKRPPFKPARCPGFLSIARQGRDEWAK